MCNVSRSENAKREKSLFGATFKGLSTDIYDEAQF